MGHAHALKGKIEKGLCRRLLDVDHRKSLAIEWLNEWGFSTSKVLEELYLSKADLPEMKQDGLLMTQLIDIKPTKDSRPRQMRIIYLSPKGRKLANPRRTGYSPPKSPASTLNSHDFMAQLAAVWIVKQLWPKPVGRGDLQLWSSGHIRHKSCTLDELENWVPDAVIRNADTRKRYYVELERSSTLDRFFKGNRLARKQYKAKERVTTEHSAVEYQFVKKIEHLSKLGSVVIVHCTRSAGERAELYFNSRVESGIPRHYNFHGKWCALEGEFENWDGIIENIQWASFPDLHVDNLLPPL
ncbi:hypothetical protein [Fluviibacter phosphoraccumulans]|uniref:hypothetical protein n=1 Tax=Fluviibacter phosphoraccumulans TaxID=1751046 RepID=UPI0010B61D45|nr:hypothetical protein [Fluviibacter phosphoraccumulans]BCA66009.1 hypothetical protein SHINM1_016110 [Fluviibacter phosphoraccumulans]